jgi:hypothetical protein
VDIVKGLVERAFSSVEQSSPLVRIEKGW